MSRALQINSSPQGWMARNTKPVPLAEKGWVITMKKISIILLSAVLVFSMAACNSGKEKADNQTEKQMESVKPTEEVAMATEAVTEVTTEAGSEETEKDIQERRLIRKITSLLIMKLLQSRKKSQSRMTSRNRKLLQVVIRKLVEIRVMQVMVVRLQTVRKTM